MSWADARATLTDRLLYAHYALYLTISPGLSSLSMFAPSIVAGLGHRDLMAQLMTVSPSVAVCIWSGEKDEEEMADVKSTAPAVVCHIVVAYSADRFNARGIHTAGAALVGVMRFVALACLPPTAYASRYGGLVVATPGEAFAYIPLLLGWLSSNLSGTASTVLAIAINVSIGGGLGQMPGVWIYKSSEAGRGYPTGHWTNAGIMDLAAVPSLGLGLFYGRENERLGAEAAGQGAQVRLYKLQGRHAKCTGWVARHTARGTE